VSINNRHTFTKNTNSIPPYVFMASCLIKLRIRLQGSVLNEAQEQLYLNLIFF